MKKLIKVFSKLVLALFLIYLLLPPAEIPPLPNSLRSGEPGDTIQISNVSAYYTDISRYEVLRFYQKAFSRSSFLNLPLLTITLNHPPEYAKEVIRATTRSTFFYELAHPLRESLFVNGWDPNDDPEYKKSKDPGQMEIREKGIYQPQVERHFERKIILRTFDSWFLARILIFLLILVLLKKTFFETRRIIVSFFKRLK